MLPTMMLVNAMKYTTLDRRKYHFTELGRRVGEDTTNDISNNLAILILSFNSITLLSDAKRVP